MEIQKIVSFLPSATELIYELNAQNLLYGVTHECQYPEAAKSLPKIITAVFDSEKMNSEEIDKLNTELVNEDKDIFKLNESDLIKIQPDLIISQNTCEVCAAHNNQVNKAIQILNRKPILHSMDPHNLNEILESVRELGKIIGKEKEAKRLYSDLKDRINSIKNIPNQNKPRVLAIEWIKPFFTAGHWVPEMIDLAGGQNLVSKLGEHSRRMNMQEVVDAKPEVIIFMPCGFDAKRSLKEYNETLQNDTRWQELDAVKNERVFVVDANSYFSKPSIRTITGLEILAKILHSNNSDITVPENSYLQV